MKRYPAALALAVLLGGTAARAAADDPTPAVTDPAPQAAATAPAPAEPTPRAMEAAKADEQGAKSAAADRLAFFEAHMAALHTGLALTPDQEKLWPPVEQAIRGFARMRAEMRHGAKPGDGVMESDPMQVLKRTSERLFARGEALKALADAAEPFYQILNEDQKRRLPVLLRDIAPRGGPVGRMVAMLLDASRTDDRVDQGRDGEPDAGPMDREPVRNRHHWRGDRRSETGEAQQGRWGYGGWAERDRRPAGADRSYARHQENDPAAGERPPMMDDENGPED